MCGMTMEITRYRLRNIGSFTDLTVNLAPTEQYPSNVTVFIGNNGAGKTSLLKSLATSLSWFVARLKSEKGNGTHIQETHILNTENSGAISIEIQDSISNIVNLGTYNDIDAESISYEWTIAKSRTGKKSEFNSHLVGVTLLADIYRTRLTENENANLPLIAFYPVERSVIDIPLKIREKHQFLQIDGYDGALDNAVNFRRFFEWFREREDVENENFKNMVQAYKEASIEVVQRAYMYEDEQLNAVRQAIHTFMPDFNNLRVQRKPRLHMAVDKNGQTLNVSQLSQGEKSLMALVGDIARRLAMMNPSLDNPLHGDGIVLIDEIDMHLHPQWQRSIIQRLQTTFPNCQFVLTTHSPLVISDIKDILVYSIEDGELVELPSLYGQDANNVLLQHMDTDYRNEAVNEAVARALDALQDNNLDKAAQVITQLEADIGLNNLEVMRLNALLKKKTLLAQRG